MLSRLNFTGFVPLLNQLNCFIGNIISRVNALFCVESPICLGYQPH